LADTLSAEDLSSCGHLVWRPEAKDLSGNKRIDF